jgi:hypothetical protein
LDIGFFLFSFQRFYRSLFFMPIFAFQNFTMLSKEIQLEVNKGAMLPLMEEFYTIQGEGYHTGTAAYFIRIGGCDVGCHWCERKLEC